MADAINVYMLMNTLLHTHTSEDTGILSKILDDVLLHGFLDTLKIIPFLLLTYLFMEFIEHKASKKTVRVLERSGKFGPALCGLLGAVPQCGFSAAASNFYTGRVITLGMLISVFLSTSDEMLPIMISGKIPTKAIIFILLYKTLVGIFVGFAVDLSLRLMRIRQEKINIDRLCEEDGCHCERGIFFSALHHTLTVGAFVFAVTLLINVLVVFIGTDAISDIMYDRPFISHIISSLVGLIPNCAVSVLLTDFCIEGFITVGTMLSGLFSGAGVGLLVLFKVNKSIKENLAVVAILIACGTLFGFLADVLNFSSLLA